MSIEDIDDRSTQDDVVIDDKTVQHPPDPQAGDGLTPPPAPEPSDNEPQIDEDDVDAVEQRDALAAVEAEKAEASGDTPVTDPEKNGAASTATPQTPAEPKAGEEPTPMVPKARLDEVLRDNAELTRKHAFVEGQNELLRTQQPAAAPGQQGDAPAAEPVITPEEQLAQNKQKRLDVAKKFDEGEISEVEKQTLLIELDDERDAVKEAQMLAKVPAPAQPQQGSSLADQHVLNQVNEQLARDHPFVDMMHETTFSGLVTQARESMGDQWNSMPPGAEKTVLLRQKVAELSDTVGAEIFGMTVEEAKAQAAQPAQQQSQSQTEQPKPASQATARRAKLDMASGMPPDVSDLSSGGTNVVPSETDIESMSDEDISALPASTKKAIEEGRI